MHLAASDRRGLWRSGLLLKILPRTIYQEMKDYGTPTLKHFDATVVLMLDFVGFTEMAV